MSIRNSPLFNLNNVCDGAYLPDFSKLLSRVADNTAGCFWLS